MHCIARPVNCLGRLTRVGDKLAGGNLVEGILIEDDLTGELVGKLDTVSAGGDESETVT